MVGWSIGNGWLVSNFYFFDEIDSDELSKTLLCPVMFSSINEKTLYIFGICNILSIPIVWALYPGEWESS